MGVHTRGCVRGTIVSNIGAQAYVTLVNVSRHCNRRFIDCLMNYNTSNLKAIGHLVHEDSASVCGIQVRVVGVNNTGCDAYSLLVNTL